jgi:hypothetical protein
MPTEYAEDTEIGGGGKWEAEEGPTDHTKDTKIGRGGL